MLPVRDVLHWNSAPVIRQRGGRNRRYARVLAAAVLPLLLSGCNWIFGLTPTKTATPTFYTCECSCVTGFALGATVRNTQDIAVRTSAGGSAIGRQMIPGTEGMIVEGPVTAPFNMVDVPWWNVTFVTDPSGWVPEVALEAIGTVALAEEEFKVCLLPEWEGAPTDDQVNTHCETTVRDALRDITGQDLPPSTSCTCAATNLSSIPTNYNSSCRAECTDPSGVCTSQRGGGGTPLAPLAATTMLVDEPAPDPLSASLFSPTSTCEVEGSAEVHLDDRVFTTSAQGTVQIHGSVCTAGEPCNVGISYHLTFGNITIPIRWHSDPTFVDLSVSGATDAQTVSLAPFIGPLYVGDVAIGGTFGAARGRRETLVDLGHVVVAGRNQHVLQLAVDWTNKHCLLAGDLAGTLLDDDGNVAELNMIVEVGGLDDGTNQPLSQLMNQPPRPDAGADQSVECTSPGGAPVSISGAGSSDADHNISWFAWREGGAAGSYIGEPSQNPARSLQQALGGKTYHLQVVDDRFAADSDTVDVNVVDTTPPIIACNAPASIFPPTAPVSFQATATDSCGATSAVSIDEFACFEVKSNGRIVDKKDGCDIDLSGDTLTILDSGGVNTLIRWWPHTTDTSSNVGQTTCEVFIARPPGK